MVVFLEVFYSLVFVPDMNFGFCMSWVRPHKSLPVWCWGWVIIFWFLDLEISSNFVFLSNVDLFFVPYAYTFPKILFHMR